jgi:hypothetical protein
VIERTTLHEACGSVTPAVPHASITSASRRAGSFGEGRTSAIIMQSCAGIRLGTRVLLRGEYCFWFNSMQLPFSQKVGNQIQIFSDRKRRCFWFNSIQLPSSQKVGNQIQIFSDRKRRCFWFNSIQLPFSKKVGNQIQIFFRRRARTGLPSRRWDTLPSESGRAHPEAILGSFSSVSLQATTPRAIACTMKSVGQILWTYYRFSTRAILHG